MPFGILAAFTRRQHRRGERESNSTGTPALSPLRHLEKRWSRAVPGLSPWPKIRRPSRGFPRQRRPAGRRCLGDGGSNFQKALGLTTNEYKSWRATQRSRFISLSRGEGRGEGGARKTANTGEAPCTRSQ